MDRPAPTETAAPAEQDLGSNVIPLSSQDSIASSETYSQSPPFFSDLTKEGHARNSTLEDARDFSQVSSDDDHNVTIKNTFPISDNVHTTTPQVVRMRVPVTKPSANPSQTFGGAEKGVVIPPVFSFSSPWRET